MSGDEDYHEYLELSLWLIKYSMDFFSRFFPTQHTNGISFISPFDISFFLLLFSIFLFSYFCLVSSYLSLTSSLFLSLSRSFFFTQHSIFLALKLFTPISRACLFFAFFQARVSSERHFLHSLFFFETP